MPTTSSPCTRFAPVTTRERNRRRGSRGSASRACRTTNATSSAPETAPVTKVALALRWAISTMVKTPAIRPAVSSAALGTSARRVPAAGVPASTYRRVPTQVATPTGRLTRKIQRQSRADGQDAARQQADRAAGGGDEAVHADRAGALGRVGEERDDHAEHDRRGERTADALHQTGGDQHPGGGREGAGQRGRHEDGQPDEEDPTLPDQVAHPSREQEQAAEGDQVGVDHPAEVVGREVRGRRRCSGARRSRSSRPARSSGRRHTTCRGRASGGGRRVSSGSFPGRSGSRWYVERGGGISTSDGENLRTGGCLRRIRPGRASPVG